MSHLRPIAPDTTAVLGSGPARRVAGPAPWPAVLGRWLARLREREEMLRMDERERRDAGLTAYDVAIECRKWPWQA